MKYDISKQSAPKMPNLGKGTECIKILLSQVSKDMHQPLLPMLFPVLGAHVSGAEFQYPDLTWKELCGQMANLFAESGGNKGQLSHLVEAICRDFRLHDETELKKLVEMADRMCGGHKQVTQVFRKFITYSNQTGLYSKTAKYRPPLSPPSGGETGSGEAAAMSPPPYGGVRGGLISSKESRSKGVLRWKKMFLAYECTLR